MDETATRTTPGDRRSRRLHLAALVVVLAAVWLPRGWALDRLVTPDEPLWLARSANFYQAISQGNWADTYQYVHPGVVTMWLGAAGYLVGDRAYADEAPGQIDQWHDEIVTVLEARGVSPLDVLVTTRAAVVLGITLAFGAAFWFARRVFGLWTALLGSLLIAFDPFDVAHSRLLHVDAPTTALITLSLLAFLSYLTTGRRKRDLVASGIVAGLAALARSPGLILVPSVGLLLLGQEWQDTRGRYRSAREAVAAVVQPFLIWIAAALAAYIALWPAMWVHPLRTASDVVSGALRAAEEGHKKDVYFNGRIYPDGDPGWLFYPVSFLWRTTPPVLIGLLLAVAALVALRRTGHRPTAARTAVLALLLFAAGFTVVMSLSAKKFDRYLLPVYPPLDLVAAWGWVEGIRWLRRRERTVRMFAAPAAAIVLAVQIAVAGAAYPYYLSSYNLLFGGARQAPEMMMVGWGEGLDQIGTSLASVKGSKNLRTRTGAWPDALAFFVPGSVVEDEYTPDAKGALRWADTDFYVLYITPKQRQWLPSELLDYFAGLTPQTVVTLQGLEYARLYDLRAAPLPDYFRTPAARMTDWGGTLRIVAYRPPYDVVNPGQKAIATFFVQNLAATDRDLGVRLIVLGANGREIAHRDAKIPRPRTPRTIWPAREASAPTWD